MENITIFFDILIALLSLWVLLKLVGYGGSIGRTLSLVGYGVVIIGFSQIVETAGLMFFNDDVFAVHIVHRFLLTLGFLLLAISFKKLMESK